MGQMLQKEDDEKTGLLALIPDREGEGVMFFHSFHFRLLFLPKFPSHCGWASRHRSRSLQKSRVSRFALRRRLESSIGLLVACTTVSPFPALCWHIVMRYFPRFFPPLGSLCFCLPGASRQDVDLNSSDDSGRAQVGQNANIE